MLGRQALTESGCVVRSAQGPPYGRFNTAVASRGCCQLQTSAPAAQSSRGGPDEGVWPDAARGLHRLGAA